MSLEDVLAQAHADLAQADSLVTLDQVRVHYLGKKGLFTERMKSLGALPPEQRKEAGAVINRAKDGVVAELEARKIALEARELEQRLARETIDVTLPGRGQHTGGLHPEIGRAHV